MYGFIISELTGKISSKTNTRNGSVFIPGRKQSGGKINECLLGHFLNEVLAKISTIRSSSLTHCIPTYKFIIHISGTDRTMLSFCRKFNH
jgi:hypothetical protein